MTFHLFSIIDSSCAKARRIDNDITTSSIFASITNSDDEADSSFEVISGEDRTEEPYMSQLRTPPHDNSETIDGSLDLLDGLHRSSTRNISIADQDDEDNEEESGGGSSAASTAADIMREMLEEFPRSNDTLGNTIYFPYRCRLYSKEKDGDRFTNNR